MINLFNNYLPIGLDIGQANIRMVQLKKAGSWYEVFNAYEKRIPFSIRDDIEQRTQFIRSSINEILNKGYFKGNEVIVATPNDSLKVKSIRLSNTEEDLLPKVKEIASSRFSLDSDKYDIDYMEAGQVANVAEPKKEVIIFAAQRALIEQQIAFLEECGLCPVSIDPLPSACFRSLLPTLRRESDKYTGNVMVDIGHRFTTIIIGKGHDIAFVKQEDLAGERFNREVAAKLGIEVQEASLLRKKVSDPSYTDDISDETRQSIKDALNYVVNELVREITLCFRYFSVTFRGQRPDKLILSGGCAYEGNLAEQLSDRLGINIELANPFISFKNNDLDFIKDGNCCQWSIALGLAIKTFSGVYSEKEVYAGN